MIEFNTVFDASKIGYHPLTIELLFGLIFSSMGTLLVFAPDFMRKYGPKGPQGKIAKCFAWVFFLFAISFTVIDSTATYNQHHVIHEAFKTGQYKTVEGVVSNFKPISSYGHGIESFMINNVPFSSVNSIATKGFGNHDGLYVRISYIENNYSNIIIKLEIKK